MVEFFFHDHPQTWETANCKEDKLAFPGKHKGWHFSKPSERRRDKIQEAHHNPDQATASYCLHVHVYTSCTYPKAALYDLQRVGCNGCSCLGNGPNDEVQQPTQLLQKPENFKIFSCIEKNRQKQLSPHPTVGMCLHLEWFCWTKSSAMQIL